MMMKFKLFFLSALLICAAVFYPAVAKDKTILPSVGIYAGLNINMHGPSFNYLLLDQTEINFKDNSNGFGGNIGIIALYPLNDIFVLSGRLGYNNVSGMLEAETIDNRYEYDVSLSYFEISPVMQFHNILPIDNLYLAAGIEAGIALSPEYSIHEDGTYLIDVNSIPDEAMRFAVIIGAGYIFDINDNTSIAPELSFRFPMTQVSSNDMYDSWDVPQIRFSVAINFGFGEQEEDDPIPSSLEVGFDEIRYYDNNGNTHQLDRITVEEVEYSELFPLVPYVFCDENQSAPSSNEQIMTGESAAGKFSFEVLKPDAMNINKQLLDVVGYRLQNTPNAELTITGTTDGKGEAGNNLLALQRGAFARDYLVKNYNLNPNKINVRASDLPEKPSSSTTPEGIAENRRIELSSSHPEILRPIIIKRNNQTIAEPNNIEFIPFAISTDSILRWELFVSQAGEVIREISGTDKPTAVQMVIIPNDLIKSQLPMEYSFTAENDAELVKTVSGTIPVDFFSYNRKQEEELPDKTIAKFSLLLFDFDSDNISDADLKIIEEDIIPAIKFNSTVKIYGYTDIIGDEDYNKRLANRRANAVKKFLQTKVKSAKYHVFGVGEQVKIFDNESPVGRQLSRTVQIHVETPR
jgi:outer membrane protein OmpA-like peptidoglycan-associated protein